MSLGDFDSSDSDHVIYMPRPLLHQILSCAFGVTPALLLATMPAHLPFPELQYDI